MPAESQLDVTMESEVEFNNLKKGTEKDLKDYLAFYLGCEVEWQLDKSCRFTLVGIANGGLHLKSEKMSGKLSGVSYKAVKLFLYSIESAIDNDIIDLENDISTVKTLCYTAEDFRKLIAEDIDLFGLIEAGLAIDKGLNSERPAE